MDDEKNSLIDSLANALSQNPQAEALFNALIPDSAEEPISKNTENEDSPRKADNEADIALPDMSTLLKLQGIMSSLNSGNHDERSALLTAIKPFLNEERRQRIDSALKLLKLADIIKIARELDLFKDFKL